MPKTTSLILTKFKVKFAGGEEVILNEGQTKMVDKAYDQWKDTGNNRFLRLGNLRILVSRLVSIEPYFDDSLAEKSRAQEGNYYLELAERLKNKKKSPLRELWIKRIKLNIERSKKNLPWLYTEEEFKKIGL